MKLYSSRTSPFARKVRVLIHELGLQEQIEELFVDPFAADSELLAVNPLSKIPALAVRADLLIPDSKLIADYLLKYKPGVLSPPRGRQRWEQLQRSYLAEGVIEAAVATVLEKRRPESIIYTAFLDRQRDNILRTLAVLEAQSSKLVTNGDTWLAEIGTGVALAYLDFRMPYLEWREQFPALGDWFRAYAQRSSMRLTQPPSS